MPMDKKLVERYADAVRVRPAVKLLPEGLREWALYYEQACLDDLRGQAGKPELTEAEILTEAKPPVWTWARMLWPIVRPLLVELLKKRWPTIAMSGAIGGASIAGIAAAIGQAINYLTNH